MLKILVAIAFSISFLIAKDVPIREQQSINIPVGEYSVFEFPFKIQYKDFTPFKYKIKKETKKNGKDDSSKNIIIKPVLKNGKPVLPEKNINIKGKDVKGKNTKNFTVQSSDNIIKFFPKKEGATELVVWGYDYPVIIEINVVKKENIKQDEMLEQYYNFIDYKKQTQEVKKFESNYHEKILEKILIGLYNNKPIPGYKVDLSNETYNSGDLEFTKITSHIGHNYIGEQWAITNNGKSNISLYEEMFAKDNVFLISFENDKLLPGETTKLFVVVGRKL